MARLNWEHSNKRAMEPVSGRPLGWVLLRCGCDTRARPQLSNPDRWWCCGGWQKKA